MTSKKQASPDNEWLDKTTEHVAREMVAWLKGTINTARPIRSLNIAEMKALAGCAMAAYEVEVSLRGVMQRPYPPVSEFML